MTAEKLKQLDEIIGVCQRFLPGDHQGHWAPLLIALRSELNREPPADVVALLEACKVQCPKCNADMRTWISINCKTCRGTLKALPPPVQALYDAITADLATAHEVAKEAIAAMLVPIPFSELSLTGIRLRAKLAATKETA
jgi:hypothetical protein